MLYWLFVFIYFTYGTCFFIFRYCGDAVLWLKPGKVHSSQFILRGQDQDRAGRLFLMFSNSIFQSTNFVHFTFRCQCLSCVRSSNHYLPLVLWLSSGCLYWRPVSIYLLERLSTDGGQHAVILYQQASQRST